MKKFSAFIVALLATVSILTSSVNPGAVVLRVVDMDDQFVEGAVVSLFDLRGAKIAEATTNEAGLAGFYNLLPGAVVVHVEYDLLLVTKTILVQGGTSVTVEIFQIPTRI